MITHYDMSSGEVIATEHLDGLTPAPAARPTAATPALRLLSVDAAEADGTPSRHAAGAVVMLPVATLLRHGD